MLKLFITVGLLITLCTCASKQPSYRVVMSDDVHLTHSQMLACMYSIKTLTVTCMTPEEFIIRSQVADDSESDDSP